MLEFSGVHPAEAPGFILMEEGALPNVRQEIQFHSSMGMKTHLRRHALFVEAFEPVKAATERVHVIGGVEGHPGVLDPAVDMATLFRPSYRHHNSEAPRPAPTCQQGACQRPPTS